MPEEPAKLEQQVGGEPAKFKNRETTPDGREPAKFKNRKSTPDRDLGRYSATESEN